MFYVCCRQSLCGPENSCPALPQKRACSDCSVFMLWLHYSCKLSLCNCPGPVRLGSLHPREQAFVLPSWCPFELQLHICITYLDQHVTVTKDVKPSKPAEEFLALYLNVVAVSFSPVKPASSDEYVMNTTYKMWFWFCICLLLYASSVYWGGEKTCMHLFLVLVMRWLCLMFDTVFCF